MIVELVVSAPGHNRNGWLGVKHQITYLCQKVWATGKLLVSETAQIHVAWSLLRTLFALMTVVLEQPPACLTRCISRLRSRWLARKLISLSIKGWRGVCAPPTHHRKGYETACWGRSCPSVCRGWPCSPLKDKACCRTADTSPPWTRPRWRRGRPWRGKGRWWTRGRARWSDRGCTPWHTLRLFRIRCEFLVIMIMIWKWEYPVCVWEIDAAFFFFSFLQL